MVFANIGINRSTATLDSPLLNTLLLHPIKSNSEFFFLPRFIMPGDVDLDDLPYEDFQSSEAELEKKLEMENRKRRELLAKVDFSR